MGIMDMPHVPDAGLPARLSAGALNATFVPRWQANTAYLAGQKVVSPNGDTVSAKADFTSGATYNAANWDLTPALAGKLDTAAAASIYPAMYVVSPAYGTGAINAQPHIQGLLNACAAAGGGTVWLPKGTYLLNSGLIIGANTTLMGVGRKSLLAPSYPSAINYVIRNDYTVFTENIILRDFAIDRSGPNVQHGILFRNVSNLLVDGLHCFGTPTTVGGFLNIGGFSAAPTVAPATDQCYNVRVVNCYMKGTDNFGIQLGGVINATIAHNVAEDCYREVIGVEPGLGLVASNIAIGLNSLGTGTTSVAGSSTTGVLVITESSGGTVRDIAVSTNTVYASTAIPGDANPGIAVYGCQNVALTGNTCRNLNGPGMSVGNASNQSSYINLTGNNVKDCNKGGNASPDACGMRLRNAIKCLVTGNWVSGALHNVALEETGSAGSNSVVGNFFLDNVNNVGTFGGNTTWANNKVALTGTNDVYTTFSFIDGRNIGIGSGSGTVFGASSSKMGFYGATAVARPSGTPAAAIDAATTQALVNDLRAKLITLGLIT